MIKHIAIIADGNRRWAQQNGLPSCGGYRQGVNVIERCCYWAIDQKIPCLSFYCFSTENWRRPKDEIDYLMNLAIEYMETNLNFYLNTGIKVNFLGRRDRLPQIFIDMVEKTEEITKECKNLQLILCFDYGGRDEIVRAIEQGAKTEEEISAILNKYAPDPDIIIRLGNDYRMSNFMLWQCAYSELFFLEKYFPELNEVDLNNIVDEFLNRRHRTFGY